MIAKHLKWVFLLILSLIWGSSFILIKKGLVGLTAFQLGSLRILFATLFLLLIGYKSLMKIPKEKWKYIALTALFGTFAPAYLFAIAETQIASSITAIINSLTPLFALLLGAFVFGLFFEKRQFVGVVVGLVGCVILIFTGESNGATQNYFYAILVVVASVCYAMNVNLIKKYLSDMSPLSITVGNFAVMFIPALLVLSCTNFTAVVGQVEVQQSMLYILVLGVVGTGIANIIFFKLIHISSPIFASSVTYLIPIVAFFWGILDNEMLTPLQFVGAAVILGGVYLSAKK
jgi:drug/metabolite transporter (DMT)-like permease